MNWRRGFSRIKWIGIWMIVFFFALMGTGNFFVPQLGIAGIGLCVIAWVGDGFIQ